MNFRAATSFKKRQRGLATILTISLLSVALIAISASMVYTMKGAHERQVAEHAQTHAQAAAWAAVEHLRQYLMTFGAGKLDSLADDFQNNGGSLQWDIEDDTNNDIEATIKNVVAKSFDGVDGHAVTAEISVVDNSAKSSSHLEIVYAILPEVIEGAIFNSNLLATGGIEVHVPSGNGGFDIQVDGDVKASSVSVGGSGVGRLMATGSIELDSSVEAEEVFSNEDVTITGGSQPKVIFAVGKVTMSGGTGVEQIYANGKVAVNGGKAGISIDSRDDIMINSWKVTEY